MRKRANQNKRWLRRLTALLLALLMLPLEALLPEGISLFPTAEAATAQNTYVLQISTGSSDGSGISFFTIEYIDTDNILHTEVVFPETGFRIARNVNGSENAMNARLEQAEGFGFDMSAWSIAMTPLDAMSTDSYVLYLNYAVQEFTAIGVHAGKMTSWSTKGIQLYKVTELYGMKMYGYISPSRFLSYKGILMVEAAMETSGSLDLFFSATGDTAWFGNPRNNNAAQYAYSLIAYPEKYNKKKSDYKDNNITYRQYASVSDYQQATNFTSESQQYLFRIDLADVPGAGIDTFNTLFNEADLQGYGSEGEVKFEECLSVTMRYMDTSGNYREVFLPITISALGWASEKAGKSVLKQIAYFAQPGQSIQFVGDFPALDHVVEWYFCYGVDTVAKAAGDTALSRETTEQNITTFSTDASMADRANVVSATNDMLYMSNISLYKVGNGTVSVSLDRKTVDVSATGTTLVSCYTAGDSETMLLQGGNYADITEGIKYGTALNGMKLANGTPEDTYLVTIQTDSVLQAGTINDMELTLHYREKDAGEDSEIIDTAAISIEEAVQGYYGFWPAIDAQEWAILTGANVSDDDDDDDDEDEEEEEEPLILYRNGNERLTHNHYTAEVTVSGETETVTRNYPEGMSSSWEGSYRYGAAVGHQLQFTVNMTNVGEITGATITMPGIYQDEYQFTSISISKVTSMGTLQIHTSNDNAITAGTGDYASYSDRYWTRTGATGLTYVDYVPDQAVLVQPGKSVTLDFSDTSVSGIGSSKAEDNEAIGKYELNYQEALRGFGLTTARSVYTLEVAVAKDEYTTIEYGDTGSTNQFFFQLVFEKDGKRYTSSYVNANQQLEGDSFRSGQKSMFNIYMNGDYGELVAVNILPDDISTASDTFDKLKIDTITVTYTNENGAGVAYVISDVGWVDISYNDVEEDYVGSRTEEDMVRTYPVTDMQYTTTLEFALLTADGTTAEGLKGTYLANIRYKDSSGSTTMVTVDLVEAIQKYCNRLTGNTGESVNNTYSDTEYMFLPNRTNRFTVDFTNISSLIDITFLVKGAPGESGVWGVKNLSVRQVCGTGVLRLKSSGSDSFGEYQKDYGDGNTVNLCTQRDGETPRTIAVDSTVSAAMQIHFTENKISALAGEDGRLTIEAEPHVSQNDKTDIQIVVKSVGTLLDGDTIYANLYYQDVYGDSWGVADIMLVYDTMYQTFILRGSNVSTPLFCIPTRLELVASKNVEIGGVQVTQVRNNTALHCFTEFGVGNSLQLQGGQTVTLNIQDSVSASATVQDKYAQTVYIAFANDSLSAELNETDDVKVQLRYYMKNDASGLLYTSVTKSLYELGITKVSPGMVVEIPYVVDRLERISEVAVFTGSDDMTLRVDRVAVRQDVQPGNRSTIVEKIGWFNCALSRSVTLSTKKTYFSAGQDSASEGLSYENRLCPLELTFTTAESENDLSTSASGLIRLCINYLDYDGNLRYYDKVADLAQMLIEGSLEAGKSGTARLLIPGVESLLTVTVTPVDFESSAAAKWKIGTLRIIGNIGSTGKDFNYSKTVNDWAWESGVSEDEGPLDINVSDRIMTGKLSWKLADSTDPQKNVQEISFNNTTEKTVFADGADASACFLVSAVDLVPGSITWVYTKQKIVDGYAGREEELTEAAAFALDNNSTYRLSIYAKEMPSLRVSVLVTTAYPEPEPEPEPEEEDSENGEGETETQEGENAEETTETEDVPAENPETEQ